MSMSFLLPHLVFELGLPGGHAVYALDALSVLQVVELSQVTPVPLAPPPVRGIMNHHGRIVTVVDPAPLLALPQQGQESAQVVILRRDGRRSGHLGLLAWRIFEIVAKLSLERVDVSTGPYVAWVAQAKKRLIHVIDLEALLQGLGHQFGPLGQNDHLGVES